MILSALSRIAGPKVLLGVLIAAGLALGWLWWMYSSAASNAAQASANADKALAAAASNAEAARAARRNAEVIAETLGRRQQREQQLRAELAQTHDQLQEARADASDEIKRCLDLPLPGPYLRELRAADGDQGGDPDAGAAAGAD